MHLRVTDAAYISLMTLIELVEDVVYLDGCIHVLFRCDTDCRNDRLHSLRQISHRYTHWTVTSLLGKTDSLIDIASINMYGTVSPQHRSMHSLCMHTVTRWSGLFPTGVTHLFQ